MIHKTTRSILSVLLAALLLVTSIPLTPAFAGGGEAVPPQSESGEGRALKPADDGKYYISTAEQLEEFAKLVNGGKTDASAVLTDDIVLNEKIEVDENGTVTNQEDLSEWTPIGNKDHLYTGTFDGDGYTISGLYINDSNADDQGLFGRVGTGGTVKDLSVSGSVKGDDYVGGVVGLNLGNVINCAFSGSVSGVGTVGGVVGWNYSGTVENCYNTGSVNGSIQAGGVVGLNSGGTVKNCYNTGSVTSRVSLVGGVVGVNSGSVTNCYNTGSVTSSDSPVGGVVGWNSGNVTNCYNTGTVSSTSNTADLGGVGGVVGYNSGTVENCYNIGEVSGMYVGGVVEYNDGGSVTGCYFLQTETVNKDLQGIGNQGSATGAAAVNDLTALCNALKGDPWTISPFYNHPVLKTNPEGGDGTKEHPYEIKTAAQLKTFRDIVNGANNQTVDPDAHAKLMNNIDLKDVCGESNSWIPIGNSESTAYTGNFNGQNFKISGLYIVSSTNNQGLFGYVGSGGTVQNLTVSGSVKGDDYVGGVVGYNSSGTVTGCIFSGSGSVSGVTGSDYVGGIVGYNDGGSVTNSYNTGDVSGSGIYVGGVVGKNSGSVENCYNTGAVNSSGNNVGGVVGWNISSGNVKNCYNTGSVKGNSYVGGVVGFNSGPVKNCYNIGDVSGKISVGGVVGQNRSSVINCYNTGSVSDGTYTGGVVGYNSGGSVTGCYFLQGTAESDIGENEGSGDATATEKDDTAFHSGEVAWRLQAGQKAAGEEDPIPQVWGQSNLTATTSLPTLVALDKNENAKPVYKVAFISDNTEIEAEYANSGMTVDLPEAPKKTDHLFGGWFNNGELTGDPVTGPISVNSDTTYYAKWTPFSYTLSATPDTLNFGSITEGEERPAAQNVTITNTGNQAVTLNPPTAENFEIGALSKTELAPNASASFTIQPKDKLPRGSYSEQITISGNDGASATITASFTVKEPPYTGKYSYEISTDIGDNGSLTVDRYATEGEKVTITVTPDEAYKLDDLTVTAHGKDVELTANGDGTFSFTMPSADVRITATFAEDPDWSEPEEPATDVSDLFIDIAPDAWYKDAVQYAYDNGLITGVSATEFDPEATTTRAMIVSILARLENVTTAEAAGFADVDDNEWYATAVNWAANVGVVNGYEDNTFKPNTAITREQLAAILMNYAAYKGEDVSNRASLATYTDQPSTWAQEAMSWAVAEGLISGVTADTLQPQGAATRAQVAAILQRFLDK